MRVIIPLLFLWTMSGCGGTLAMDDDTGDDDATATDDDDSDGDLDGDGYTPEEGDCNDEDAAVYPGAEELCNGHDDDCSGAPGADEVDADGDGVMVCSNDCNDTDDTVYPGAPEVCNAVDDDCDGSPGTDEKDDDADGWMVCEGDCDDADGGANPAEEEICQDGTDNDCNGVTDDCCMALDFDGNDYVSVEHTSELNLASGSFTTEAWAYLDAYSAYNVSPIVSKMSRDSDISHGWSIWIVGDDSQAGYLPGTPVVSISQPDGQAYGVADAGTVVSTETWFHIAATHDINTSTTTLWLDGIFVTSDTGSPPPSSNHVSLLVGLYRPLADCGGVCRYWDGVVDEVRLSSEVRYTATFTPEVHFLPDADTIALWHFSEGAGGTIYDDSGDGHDGASQGVGWVEDCP